MVTLFILAAVAAVPDDPAPARTAVARALPYLAEGGETWMKGKDCNSCHRVTFLVWANHAADRAGVAVDRPALAGWDRWVLDDTFKPRVWYRLRAKAVLALKADGVPSDVLAKAAKAAGPEQNFVKKEEFAAAIKKVLTADEWAAHGDALLRHGTAPNNAGGPDTLAQLLLARPAGSPDTPKKEYAAARALLLDWQEPDGSWLGGGQLPNQRRPRAELHQVTTMWSVLALADETDAAAVAARDRALKWLAGGYPGDSTEALLLRAAVAHRFGDKGRAAELLDLLEREQRPDGGWAWKRAAKVSDPLTTGQALYVLGLVGRGTSDPLVRRGRDYLLKTQEEDGAWAVPVAAITTGNEKRLAKVEEPYRYWGTAWAAIGLARTLPVRP